MPRLTRRTAVLRLRQSMKLSQEKMARRLRVSLRTVQRFESDLKPNGHWLVWFAELARDAARPDLTEYFYLEFAREYALDRCRGRELIGAIERLVKKRR
jgi:transcriptional regulator with XRE-family HTH domain